MPIFKEMKVAPTLAGKIMFETHPFVIFIGFMAIATILILKERVIKNKTVTYFFNSIVLIVLILLILYFLLGAFIPLFDTPITSLRGNG